MIIIKIIVIIITFDHRCSDDSGKLILTEVKDGPLLQVIRMVNGHGGVDHGDVDHYGVDLGIDHHGVDHGNVGWSC